MMTLEELGLSQQEIQQRVIDRVAEKLLEKIGIDRDEETGSEDEITIPTSLQTKLETRCKEAVDAAIKDIGDKHILPRVSELIESSVLQKTNEWGQKSGSAKTFTEYLVERAQAWIQDEVDYEGKTKEQSSSCSFKKSGTRVGYMVEKHLQYSIERAMKDALQTANSAIAGGIENAVKIKLQEVLNGIKTTVTVKT